MNITRWWLEGHHTHQHLVIEITTTTPKPGPTSLPAAPLKAPWITPPLTIINLAHSTGADHHMTTTKARKTTTPTDKPRKRAAAPKPVDPVDTTATINQRKAKRAAKKPNPQTTLFTDNDQ